VSRQTAEYTFATAKYSYQEEVLSLTATARSDYYAIMQDGEFIKSDERKVASSRKLVDITQALVDAGKSAAVDIMRTKIQLQTDERQLQNDQILREQALLQAKYFAYLPLDADVAFVTELEFSHFNVPLQRLLDYAVLHNPTLESSRIAKEQSMLDYQTAIKTTRPVWALSGTYNTNDEGIEPDIVSRGWTLTSEVSWLFFDSFVTRDTARNARIAEWVADLNLRDSERNMQMNIQNEYMDIKRTEKQIDDFKFTRQQAHKNVDILRLRFQNGLAALLDVLNAENDERALDAEYLGLLVQFNQAKDQLSEQLGAEVETLQ
jgi:outer membrane protein TolC